MAARIPPPPPTAFAATSRRTKRERVRDKDYLAWIRTLPCVISRSTFDVQAAHVSYDDLRCGKLGRGKGDKEDDCWALPVQRALHEEQHGDGDERAFWDAHGIDPVVTGLALWRCYQMDDRETALIVIEHARN